MGIWWDALASLAQNRIVWGEKHLGSPGTEGVDYVWLIRWEWHPDFEGHCWGGLGPAQAVCPAICPRAAGTQAGTAPNCLNAAIKIFHELEHYNHYNVLKDRQKQGKQCSRRDVSHWRFPTLGTPEIMELGHFGIETHGFGDGPCQETPSEKNGKSP